MRNLTHRSTKSEYFFFQNQGISFSFQKTTEESFPSPIFVFYNHLYLVIWHIKVTGVIILQKYRSTEKCEKKQKKFKF